MQIEPRNELKNLSKTVHGGQAWRLDGIEDYSQNLNPLGPPPGLAELVSKAASSVNHYPDAECVEVRKKIAEYYGLEPSNVAMGAGSSEIIRNFPFAFVSPGDSVLIPSPSFAEYTQQAKLAGAQIDYLPLRKENNFHIDTKELFEVLKSKHYKAFYICNPNNPTGRVESRARIEEIVRFCDSVDTMVFLDETLLSLCADNDQVSMVKYVNDYTNLIIAKSFTKSFAIPGMRIGFALSNPAIIAEMEKVKLPWNLGAIEQAVAAHLIEFEMDYVKEAAYDLRKESARIHSLLEGRGFDIPVSDSFFYFVSLKKLGVSAAEFTSLMLKNGIMVRDCSSFGPEYVNYIRYCVKGRETNDRFFDAVDRTLKQIGV